MRTFIAPVIASLLCLCAFCMPLPAQAVGNVDAIDVHLHAMNPRTSLFQRRLTSGPTGDASHLLLALTIMPASRPKKH